MAAFVVPDGSRPVGHVNLLSPHCSELSPRRLEAQDDATLMA